MQVDQTNDRITRVIFEYAARIGQEQDTDTFLGLNADMAKDLVGADRCSIWLVDAAAQQLHTRVAHGVGEIRIALGQGLVGACVARGEPVVVNDTSADERFSGNVDRSSGYVTRSVLVIPLRAADGSILGAFQALNKPGGFTAEDVLLLQLAASYSASAVETQRLRLEAEEARIMLHELEIARDVQAKMVPQAVPVLKGLECAYFFRPAKFVGGDYYDFAELQDGGFAFTLGDVSGKGIPAALLMASIQSSLRIPMRRGSHSLRELMIDLNASVYASSTASKYSTLFCGVVDATRTRLAYINAGHCPPILVRQGAVERLKTGGPPIGLIPVAPFSEGAISLVPGDLLVCFSDGISEATNAKEEIWEEAELEKILVSSAGNSASEVTEMVVRCADEFTGDAEQADDMTVVTLRIL